MKYVDRALISVKSGQGGQGAVSFRREKFVAKGGPDGGNGGDGGDVVLYPTTQLQTLMDLSIKKNYRAKNGEPGRKKMQFGSRAEDLVICVPVGTLVFDENDQLIADLSEADVPYIVAKGGKGGQGNANFSTSTNRAPRYAQPGMPGEEKTIALELRMIAEIGLVGLPNAGKSTLLKTLTQANVKIDSYPFTTKYPNLGVLRYFNEEIVMADIPGLIEGSSKGLGLGHDFLRHIDRTRILVHLVGSELEPEHCLENYRTITEELAQSPYFNSEKPVVVVLSKIDIIDSSVQEEIIRTFKNEGIEVLPVSSATRDGIDTLVQTIYHHHDTMKEGQSKW